MIADQVPANQVLDRCDSTNDLARKLGEEGCPHGTWISTRVQEKGRGRLGREWRSMEGNLFLSIVVRPAKRDLWTWVPLATALAIAEVLNVGYGELGVRVKWPNDLWIERKKLGGILCEAVGARQIESAGSFIVIGIGLNCAAAPQGLDQPTTSLSERAGRVLSADDVRAGIIASVLNWMELDTRKISSTYERLAALPSGSEIGWAGGTERGSVLGLGSSGELRVRNSNGEAVSLYAEDVSIAK